MQAEHKLQQTKLGKLNATIQKDQREEQAKMMALRDDAQLSHGIKDSLEQRGLPTLMDKDDEAAPPTAQAVPAADAAGVSPTPATIDSSGLQMTAFKPLEFGFQSSKAKKKAKAKHAASKSAAAAAAITTNNNLLATTAGANKKAKASISNILGDVAMAEARNRKPAFLLPSLSILFLSGLTEPRTFRRRATARY